MYVVADQGATLYLRISLDRTGQQLGVTRQETMCRELCTTMGWPVAAVFADNSISATSGKRRPGFEAMIASRPRLIVMWSVDRLVRRGPDLERLIDLDIPIHSVQAGPMDLATASGRLNARLLTSVASFESEMKAERQKASHRQRAEAGRPWFVSSTGRPTGWNLDGTLHAEEAGAIRDAYRMLLAGMSLRAIAKDLNGRGLTTSRCAPWSSHSLRTVLTNPRNAGIVVRNGAEVGPSLWPAIIDEVTLRAAQRVFRDPSRRQTPGPAVAHLLSGLVTCGRCGRLLQARRDSRPGRRRIYQCEGFDTTYGADWLDDIVTRYVLARLAAPDGIPVWARPGKDAGKVEARAERYRSQLNDLAEDYTDGAITRDQFRIASRRLQERLRVVEVELVGLRAAADAGGVLGAVRSREQWDGTSLERRRAIIRALMETITVQPRGRGARSHDPDLVDVAWRDG